MCKYLTEIYNIKTFYRVVQTVFIKANNEMLNLVLKVFLLQKGKSKMPWFY